MRVWKDYDLSNPSTWTVMSAPEVDPKFTAKLTEMAGLNPFGRPVLRMVWGATALDEMAVGSHLKYWLANKEAELSHFEFTCPVTGMQLQVKTLEEVPKAVLIPIPKYKTVELGERRFIVEIWRSPSFLAASNRYTETSTCDNGETREFYFCRNCGAELSFQADAGPKPCLNCGSRRHFVQEMKDAGEGKLLHTNPTEGAYDFFCRLESGTGAPLVPDDIALGQIYMLWLETKKPRREKLKDMVASVEGQAVSNLRATSPTNPFISPTVAGW